MLTKPKYLVLDLSWLRSVSGRAVPAILDGFTPVMIDTLVYETSTSNRAKAWEEGMTKLAPLASTTCVWRPISEFLIKERDSGVGIDVATVETTGRYLSAILPSLSPRLNAAQKAAVAEIANNRQEKPSASLAELVDKVRWLLKGADIESKVKDKKLKDIIDLTQALCSIPGIVMAVHSFVTQAARDEAPALPMKGGIWYREAQGIIAYAVDACRAQGVPVNNKLPNWKHDLDYAIMGSMTGYLATKDQRTAFAAICINPDIALCGQTTLPLSEEVATAAYFHWLDRGSAHGHAVNDWLSAEQELLETRRFRWHWTQ